MSYTQLLLGPVNVECVAKQNMALAIWSLSGLMPSSVHVAFFLFCLSLLIGYVLWFGAMLSVWCVGVMFRLVVSGPMSLSLSTFSAALILGFVCSIWAKFSNGDNNRGRPGERRRWVLPFKRVSCMLLQASQLHLPAFPSVYFHFSHRLCHQWFSKVPCPHVAISLPQTNCYFTPESLYLLN